MSEKIGKTSFKGHKGSVLCLAHCKSLLLSGSEDETARVWDLRISRTALCLVTGDQVTSVAFAPPTTPEPLAGLFARDASV
jgi:WD40 repeat protein